MEGRLFVTGGGKPGAADATAAPRATAATAEPGITYPVETWRAMARIIAGHWIYDMADNFAYSMNLVFRGDALTQLSTEWSAIESFWQQQTGTTKTILLRDPDSNSFSVDPSAFLGESRDKLEALGRRIRGARRKLRTAGVNPTQYPYPDRPDDPDAANPFGRLYGGQSDDPFGEAITVNYAGLRLSPDPAPEALGALRTEVQLAELRHEHYALGPLWSIETLQDSGGEVPDNLKQEYQTNRTALLVDDYHTLAAHLYFGLSKLFKSEAFQEDQFVTGVRRMTVRGEWLVVAHVALAPMDRRVHHRQGNGSVA
jgi:hypothetical protein